MLYLVRYFSIFVLSIFCISAVQAQGYIGAENDMVDGARSGNIGVMERGYLTGLSASKKSRSGDPVIVIAAGRGDIKAIRYLIHRKARIDDRGQNEKTALSIATALGYTNIMEALLDAGADPNRTGIRKEVPIIQAARAGHLKAVILLATRGAFLEDTDLTGRTALDWAIMNRHERIVAYLESLR